MPLLEPTRALLTFLRENPAIRARIAAAPNKSLFYAGHFIRPIWRELEDLKRTEPEVANKQLLPDVLKTIAVPKSPYPHLLAWAQHLDKQTPWKDNGFIVWRALSGIYASNAKGKVSFSIGSGVTKADKVFAATELQVLLRNPHIDEMTKDLLSYYDRCVKAGVSAMNIGLIRSS